MHSEGAVQWKRHMFSPWLRLISSRMNLCGIYFYTRHRVSWSENLLPVAVSHRAEKFLPLDVDEISPIPVCKTEPGPITPLVLVWYRIRFFSFFYCIVIPLLTQQDEWYCKNAAPNHNIWACNSPEIPWVSPISGVRYSPLTLSGFFSFPGSILPNHHHFVCVGSKC